ncbi:MAG: M81 family metallopeptidase [Acetobacteraceae bacterium]|nr:M81 family metallopeptidase [Acetobacteraceae bacterium]
MPLRLMVAMFKHETNTFSPVPTRWEDFSPCEGDAAYRLYRHSGYAMSGLLDEAEAMGADVFIPLAARALPSAPVARDAFERLSGIFCAAARECDAMLLDLHGAMVAEHHEDGEGELLARIRHVRPGLPIGAALDSHANITDRFVANCSVMPGYRSYPHLDMPETGRRAGRLLREVLEGRLDPVTVRHAVPMLPDMVRGLTDREPMSRLIAAAAAEEAAGLPCCTVFTGFPLADTRDTGMTVLATAHGDRAVAEAAARRVGELAWSLREEFTQTLEPIEETMARARAMPPGMIVLADQSDNCHSGGPMDDVTVIQAALDAGLDGILAGPVRDPAAVAACCEAGIGATVSLQVGAWTPSPWPRRKLAVRGTITRLGIGRFTVEGPVFTGMPVDLGRCAVIETPRLTLVLSEGRVEGLDPLQYRHFGLEPTRFRHVILKSKTNHRPAFLPLAAGELACHAPGVASLDLRAFPWKRLRRPIFPFDRSNDA